MSHFVRLIQVGSVVAILAVALRAAADDAPPSAAFPIEAPSESPRTPASPSPRPSSPAPAESTPSMTPRDETRADDPNPSAPDPTQPSAGGAASDGEAPAERGPSTRPAPAPRSPDLRSEPDRLPPPAGAPQAGNLASPTVALVIAAPDHDAVFRAFASYAETERRARIGGAIGGVVAGAATIGMGVAFADYFNFSPEPFYLLGGIAAVAPLLGLFSSSSAESYARQIGADRPGHSEGEALALRRSWASLSRDARSRRHWSAGVSFVLSAVSFGFGVAVLEGTFSLPRNDRVLWGSVLMGAAGGMAASGAGSLLILSPVEAAYEQFEATLPLKARPSVAFGAGPSGGGVRVAFSF
jgi:hypothetical protein